MSPIFGFNGTLWYREGTVVAVKARNPRLLDEGIVVGWLFRSALELRIDPFAGNLVTHDLQCASTISGKGSANITLLSVIIKRMLAARAADAVSHQPRTDHFENLFPRQARSFF